MADLSKEEAVLAKLRELAEECGLNLMGAGLVLDPDGHLSATTMQVVFEITEDAYKSAEQIKIDREFKNIEREIKLDERKAKADAKLDEIRRAAEERLRNGGRGKGFLDD